MIKIFSSEVVKAADKYTIENEPIESIDLMERAATLALKKIRERFAEDDSSMKHFSIFCGVGNNGGDGLVIARELMKLGYLVQVYIVEFTKNYSEDFKTNLERLDVQPTILNPKAYQFELKSQSIVIDAIFGSGLNRKIEGFTAAIIDAINEQSDYTISIDVPSGLFPDATNPEDKSPIICSDYIVCFEFPKLAFLVPENADYVKEWEIVPIGIHEEFIKQTGTSYYLMEELDILRFLKKPSLFSHKGEQGRALLITGSKGKVGAAVLAAKACLRSGVGLLTIQSPACAYSVLQTAVPEAMVEVDTGKDYLSELKLDLKFDSLGIGPGIGTKEPTSILLKLIIQQNNSPMVIDADALNILSENRTWLSFLPKGSILTPHIKEFERMVGKWSNADERLDLLIETAKKYQIYIALKGRNTAIACPNGEVYFNTTGNPGMATGGSGDVLTGILTGLLAQGYASKEAAIFGVFLHGLAGDIAAEKFGYTSMIASDIIDNIYNAYQFLNKRITSERF